MKTLKKVFAGLICLALVTVALPLNGMDVVRAETASVVNDLGSKYINIDASGIAIKDESDSSVNDTAGLAGFGITYDKDQRILTLDNVNIKTAVNKNHGFIYAEGIDDLTIVLKGANKLENTAENVPFTSWPTYIPSSDAYGMYLKTNGKVGMITFKGAEEGKRSGSLYVQSNSDVIRVEGNITIKDTELNINAVESNGLLDYQNDPSSGVNYIQNSKVHLEGSNNAWIGLEKDLDVSDSEIDVNTGTGFVIWGETMFKKSTINVKSVYEAINIKPEAKVTFDECTCNFENGRPYNDKGSTVERNTLNVSDLNALKFISGTYTIKSNKRALGKNSGDNHKDVYVIDPDKMGFVAGDDENHLSDDVTLDNLYSYKYVKIFDDDHSEREIRNKRAATATSTGYTGDTCCKLCGKIFEKGTEIEKLKNVAYVEDAEDGASIVDTIAAKEAGETVKINMNGAAEIGSDIISALKKSKAVVEIKAGNNIKWTIDGSSISKTLASINLGVTLGGKLSKAAEEKAKALVGNNKYINLDLSHNGSFGLTAKLTVNVGAEKTGKYANLHYFNPVTGAYEFLQASKIMANGETDFNFEHASEYTIVFTDEPMKADDTKEPTTTTEPATNADTTATAESPKTGDTTNIVLLLALMMLAATGSVYIVRRKVK